jgi:hypothetical protein
MKKVIRPTNLPSKVPTTFTIASGLLNDRLSAPQWVWGVWATIIILIWIISLVSIYNDEYTDIFGDKKN